MRALSLLAVLFLGKAAAFWQYGHLFVARVAYDNLQFTKTGQSALKAANNMLKIYSSTHPDMIESEGNYPFVECSTFADEIKAKGMSWQSGWHFVDTPYLDEGGTINDYPNFKPDPDTVDLAIRDIINWLSNQGDYTNSFAYQTIMANNVGTADDAKSFALRLLIHYIGDIHQPLHATARVDSKYPKGDAGGNFFKVPTKLGAKNLHSVWDSIIYLWTGTPDMPLSYNEWNTQGSAVAALEQKYQFQASEWKNLDVEMWAKESFELSKSNVYPGIKENEPLPDDYVTKNQDAIQRQIVLGGLRLSYVIQTIFAGSSEEQTEEVPSAFLQ